MDIMTAHDHVVAKQSFAFKISFTFLLGVYATCEQAQAAQVDR